LFACLRIQGVEPECAHPIGRVYFGECFSLDSDR